MEGGAGARVVGEVVEGFVIPRQARGAPRRRCGAPIMSQTTHKLYWTMGEWL